VAMMEIRSQGFQTEVDNSEKQMQTEQFLKNQKSQTESNYSNKHIQVKLIEDKKIEMVSKRTQSSQSNLIDTAIQTFHEESKKTRDVSQYVIFKSPTATSNTQTDDTQKKTRTGGVQVCIGNRMHYRKLLVARILHRLATVSIVEEGRLEARKVQGFFRWQQKCISSRMKAAQSLKRTNCLLKLGKVEEEARHRGMRGFFDKLKENAIK
jgi:hypothetical protein